MYRQNRALVDLVRPVIEAMGYEFWGLEQLSRPRRALLRIYIDCPGGVTLADCERVSHEVTGVLDVEDAVTGSYDLEVSSPGLDRPLFTLEQILRYAGREVRIRMSAKIGGRRQLTGYIEGVEAEGVVIRTAEGEHYTVPSVLIERARLVPHY
ncbi:MAG: ribosome maturation factor RimP [Gammaproteobacteria bacterium]